MKDIVGWTWDDIQVHVEDDLRTGAFPMPKRINRVKQMKAILAVIAASIPTIPMDDEPVHLLPEHPFCDDMSCGCHDDIELIQEYLTTPWQAGHLTNSEADRLFHGQQKDR